MTYSEDFHLTPATYTASVVTMIAGLTINEWVAIGGFTLGLLTFLTNLYYKHKHYTLAYKGSVNKTNEEK